MPVIRLDQDLWFPTPELAEENGLLAIGGDLRAERLLMAYHYGIFPWYNPGEEILWWCPKERFIIRPQKIHISHSMKKFLRKTDMTVTINQAFSQVIHNCRILREELDGTWITDEMEQAYQTLHVYGYATSVEVWQNRDLVGGLYGVDVGKCFFGESMFSRKENASKVALITLAKYLEKEDYEMIDCQFHTEHLESMGGEYISYREYRELIEDGTKKA